MPAREITRASRPAELPGMTAAAVAALERQGLRTVGQVADALRGVARGRASPAAAAAARRIPRISQAYATHRPRGSFTRERGDYIAARLVRAFKAVHPDHTAVAVGSLRRRRARVGDIDLLTTLPSDEVDIAKVLARASGKMLAEYAKGPFRRSGIVSVPNEKGRDEKVPLDVFHAPPAEWGTALLHYTGNAAFNVLVRAQARRRGYSMSQHGLRELATGRMRRYASEREALEAAGVRWHAPAARTKTLAAGAKK